jgi:hypothetical protein
MGQNELRRIESGFSDDRRIARGAPFSRAIDGGESLRLAALDPVERVIDERNARRRVEIVSAGDACSRERRVRGPGAQSLARLIDRVRLDGPRLCAAPGKRGVGARVVVHACARRR